MAEAFGNVTEFIKMKDGRVFGLKFGADEYIYSFPDQRGEPFMDARVSIGSQVRVEWAPFTDKKGKEKKYANVLEVLDGDAPIIPSGPKQVGDDYPPPQPGQELWAKDRLRARTDCIACATGIYKSCIEGGFLKTLPTSEELIAYAAALEKWARESTTQ